MKIAGLNRRNTRNNPLNHSTQPKIRTGIFEFYLN